MYFHLSLHWYHQEYIFCLGSGMWCMFKFLDQCFKRGLIMNLLEGVKINTNCTNNVPLMLLH